MIMSRFARKHAETGHNRFAKIAVLRKVNFAGCFASLTSQRRDSSMETQATHSITDESILAALDIEYQAVVQNNDAGTMDRILADDFVLIIGNGTVFTKADLLQEAVEKACIYELQEATEKKAYQLSPIGFLYSWGRASTTTPYPD
jgi:hypothetical protein